MKKFGIGAAKDRVIKILPEQFDPELVEGFFSDTENSFQPLGKAFGQAVAEMNWAARDEMRDKPHENTETSDADADSAGIVFEADLAPGKFSKGPSWKTDTKEAGGKGRGAKKKEAVQEDERDGSGDQPAPTIEEEVAKTGTDPVILPEPEPAEEEKIVETAPEAVGEKEGVDAPSEPAIEDKADDTASQPGSNNYVTNAADYVTNADNPDAFNISLNFSEKWTDTQKLAFIEGAELVSDYVYGDLPDVNGIDDVHIDVVTTTWSGWAWGGPDTFRSDGTTASGDVLYSEGNMAAMEGYGVIDDFAFHEILHVLGFGTSWGGENLVENIDGQLRFMGQNAIEAYNDPDGYYADVAEGDAGSFDGVPIQDDGWHLDHNMLGSEIMSPSLNISNNVISEISIAMIEDMGYETVYGDDSQEEADLFALV